MPNLVRENVSLRKLSWGAEALFQFIVETQIDINLFVSRAVKGSCGGFRPAATRIRFIAEQHECDKLHQRFFRFIERRIRAAHRRCGCAASAAQQRKEILFENEAEDKEDDQAADADVHSAEAESSAATAALIAAIFDIFGGSAGCPAHD